MSRVRSLAVAFMMLLSGFAAAPASAQLKPLDVASDPNGVDLLSAKIETQPPVLSVPGAGHLNFKSLQDLQPFLQGKLVAPSPDGEASYDINNGGIASEHFDCDDNIGCKSKKKNGSVLIADPAGKYFQYYQGGTAMEITFNLQNNNEDDLVGDAMFHFYPSSIRYPNGEVLTFAYESYVDSGIGLVRRPSSVTSSLGYKLVLAYQQPPGQPLWLYLAQATIYKSDNLAVPLARNTYSGSTITDLAGRVFTCGSCSIWLGGASAVSATSLRLPGETVDTLSSQSAQCESTGYQWVSQVTTDGVTYNYDFNPTSSICKYVEDVTITGPLGFSRFVDIYTPAPPNERSRVNSVRDSLNRTTSYLYDNDLRVTRITYPEGNWAGVSYDGIGNITESRLMAKAGSGIADIVETASFASSGCIPGTGCICIQADCFKPQWTQDAKGQQTDYTWASHGGMLTRLEPVDASGKRRKTINEYSAGPVFRLLRERVCATDVAGVELTCGTANELVKEFTYWGSTLLPLTETVKDGTGGQARTTTFTYDAAGRLLSSDGPTAGTDDATYNRYDTAGRKTWEIGPKGANGYRAATRTIYRDADNQPLTIEKGTIVNDTDTVLTVVNTQYLTYNTRRKVIKQRTAAGGSDLAVSQMSYDARNRDQCTAVRMNSAAWASLPADACTLGTAGTQGADRITRTNYDAESRVILIEKAVGTSREQDYAAYTYTVNGKKEFTTDANGNKAKFQYDGHDRQTHWWFPSKTTVGTVSTTDYEQYGYDANGNRTSLRKRDGSTLCYAYDALNRVISKTMGPACGDSGGGGTNQPPVAINDSTPATRCQVRTVNVTSNDTDPDGDSLIVISASSGTMEASAAPPSSVNFTVPDQAGTFVVNYTISDGRGGTDTASLTVTVPSTPLCP